VNIATLEMGGDITSACTITIVGTSVVLNLLNYSGAYTFMSNGGTVQVSASNESDATTTKQGFIGNPLGHNYIEIKAQGNITVKTI